MSTTKWIKAIDTIVAGLEEMKEALELGAGKSGDEGDDAPAGKVSRSGKKAAADAVPSAGKKSGKREVPDDDADVGGPDDADGEGDGEDLPEPEAVAAKVKPAAKKAAPAAKKAGGKKAAPAEDDAPSLDDVKQKLVAVMNNDDLGKAVVKKILAKYGVEKSSELEESDYAEVIAACDAKLASVEGEEV